MDKMYVYYNEVTHEYDVYEDGEEIYSSSSWEDAEAWCKNLGYEPILQTGGYPIGY